MKLKKLIKGFLIAKYVIPEIERRTGEDLRQAKSTRKIHRLPANLRARISYAIVYARKPSAKAADKEPMTSDAM
jgi:hypothetical protein